MNSELNSEQLNWQEFILKGGGVTCRCFLFLSLSLSPPPGECSEGTSTGTAEATLQSGCGQ